jgi:hypothetical protein
MCRAISALGLLNIGESSTRVVTATCGIIVSKRKEKGNLKFNKHSTCRLFSLDWLITLPAGCSPKKSSARIYCFRLKELSSTASIDQQLQLSHFCYWTGKLSSGPRQKRKIHAPPISPRSSRRHCWPPHHRPDRQQCICLLDGAPEVSGCSVPIDEMPARKL